MAFKSFRLKFLAIPKNYKTLIATETIWGVTQNMWEKSAWL